MPKSASFTSPAFDTMMLAGETSRWTMPQRAAVLVMLRVRVGQRLQRLVRDEIRQRRGQPGVVPVRVPLHQPRQIAADDVLLGHEVFAVDDAEVEHGHDVRVHEARLQAGLVDELRDRLLVARQLRAQALEHERAREPGDAGRLGHGRSRTCRLRPADRGGGSARTACRRARARAVTGSGDRRLRRLAPGAELQRRLARQLHGDGPRRRCRPRCTPLPAPGHQQADAAEPHRRRDRPRQRSARREHPAAAAPTAARRRRGGL